MRVLRNGLITVLLQAALVAPAGAATFKTNPIIVNGSDLVDVWAINDSDAVTGQFIDKTGQRNAFVLSEGKVTVLRQLNVKSGYPVVVQPSAINNNGAVTGQGRPAGSFSRDSFLWRSGKYWPRYQTNLSGGVNTPPASDVGLNDKGQIFFTLENDLQEFSAFAGIPPHMTPIGPNSTVAIMNSFVFGLNQHGVAGGCGVTFDGVSTVFTYDLATYTATNLAVPNAVSACGGYINDRGDVAGEYTDAAGVTHGFVYHGGTYSTFDPPTPGTLLTLSGLNNLGRIAGTYVSAATGFTSVFLYNGKSSVAVMNTLPASTRVAMNNLGVIVISVPDAGANFHQSFEVTCTGPGC
jgi:hypothetical protein